MTGPASGTDVRSQLTDRILTLTLDIICLLTGERCAVVKMAAMEGLLQGLYPPLSGEQSPITAPPPSPTSHRNMEQKVLEVINQVIGLLTGEPGSRSEGTGDCGEQRTEVSGDPQYLTHERLYKAAMLEEEPAGRRSIWCGVEAPPSCDGAADPVAGRCVFPAAEGSLRPVCSREPTEEGQWIPGCDQLDDCCAEEIKEEEGGWSSGPSHLYTHPLYSRDSSQDHQSEDMMELKVTIKEEEEDPYEAAAEADMTASVQNVSPGISTGYGEGVSQAQEGGPFSSVWKVEGGVSCPVGGDPALGLFCEEGSEPCDPRESFYQSAAWQMEDPFLCSACGERFTSEVSYQSHLAAHSDSHRFSCSECGKSFKQKTHLVLHQRSHTGERPFSCSECGKRFADKARLTIHQRYHTGENLLTCSECGKQFAEKSKLTIHQRYHTGENLFTCSECGKQFAEKFRLAIHQRYHTGENLHTCSECGRSFLWKSELEVHIRRHRGEKPFSCSECGKSFKQKTHLVLHQRSHTGERPFSCSECGKRFAEKSKLTIHQRHHTGENLHTCSECGKQFVEKSKLTIHQRYHTGQNLYSCAECGKQFAEKFRLTIHQRFHTGDKLHTCPECGRRFLWKSELDVHIRRHRGEKPFSCSECAKCFVNRAKLNQHIKKSHPKHGEATTTTSILS